MRRGQGLFGKGAVLFAGGRDICEHLQWKKRAVLPERDGGQRRAMATEPPVSQLEHPECVIANFQ